MKPSAAAPGEPLVLRGGPYERGRAQAALCPDLVGHVRHAIAHRLAETRPAFAREEVRRFVDGQRAVTAGLYPEILEEIRGIADGFDLAPGTVFDYLHCSTAMDVAALPEHEPEGCTSFAVSAGRASGALVAKNRDYRPEHIPIQRVMRHADPAWGGREVLVLGSLGSPGNFSSGMNGDGLAVTDTASRTTDMGVGFHRYFLLTWLLVHCATVDEAQAAIRRTTHTGGGLLLLGDASGAVAAVELGHSAIGFEHKSSGRVGRTNHFVTPHMAPTNLRVPAAAASRANSLRRFPCLSRLLAALPEPPGVDDAGAVLAYHGEDGGEAFCRHGGDDLGTTIAGAIWLTGERRLLSVAGNPCRAAWERFDIP
ncbi:MAG TPA: C45 family peptidase [Geminicoccaceae bacterium]|nr:C45 family peptidase [Geminicoccaceae bacterium]